MVGVSNSPLARSAMRTLVPSFLHFFHACISRLYLDIIICGFVTTMMTVYILPYRHTVFLAHARLFRSIRSS